MAKDTFTLQELEDKKVVTIFVQLSVIDGHKIWSARFPDEEVPNAIGSTPIGVLRTKLMGHLTDLGATPLEKMQWLE